jgi:hypothetical protein
MCVLHCLCISSHYLYSFGYAVSSLCIFAVCFQHWNPSSVHAPRAAALSFPLQVSCHAVRHVTYSGCGVLERVTFTLLCYNISYSTMLHLTNVRPVEYDILRGHATSCHCWCVRLSRQNTLRHTELLCLVVVLDLKEECGMAVRQQHSCGAYSS